MEDSKRKPVMIGIIVACLVLAVVVHLWLKEASSGADALESGRMIWVKCRNPECEAEYQMNQKKYFKYIQESRADPMQEVLLPCKECGEESITWALKCPKCGLVFERYSVPNDRPDRCPKCGFSPTEDRYQKHRKARQQ